ncbi:MAG: pyridoxal phosphate-dependent aminotransferase family protein [Bacteroidia bacterium]|nr:pyridoxal phosphate-dependent aminotransferase family protein [Bacteroidia bacterium]
MQYHNEFEKRFQKELIQRKESGLLRTLVVHEKGIDFWSNDYLGLAVANNQNNNLSNGSTGSRLISGNSVIAMESEHKIAKYHGAESALIFNNGYMANLGLFSCIAGRNDRIFYDEYCHASMIDGMRLSHAKRKDFKHNNTEELESLLKENNDGRSIVAVESVYSMDGDVAPLEKISEICEKYNAALIVDEAHATGILGEKGEGLVSALNLQNKVLACVYTFGKALGRHGAAVTGSEVLVDYLINHARSFIYTTALPPASYHEILNAYESLNNKNLRIKLFENINYFKNKINEMKMSGIQFKLNDSPIQSFIISGNEAAKKFADYLLEKGFLVKAILSPTVPQGLERIRICLHSFNTFEEINELTESIKNCACLIYVDRF